MAESPNIDLSKLSDADRRELERFVNHEVQKGRIQESVHNLTDICFSKCVTGKIGSGALERGEESCARNCVERFMDANDLVIGRLEGMMGAGPGPAGGS